MFTCFIALKPCVCVSSFLFSYTLDGFNCHNDSSPLESEPDKTNRQTPLTNTLNASIRQVSNLRLIAYSDPDV